MCQATLDFVEHQQSTSLASVVVSKEVQTWCLTSTETVRLIRDGERRRGEGVWRWGGEGDYIPIATRSPPE